jgi:drug/metabolite transporter (DMT)-like permease
MAATKPSEWQLMLLAGVGNALSFVALTISLRLTSVVYVNSLNATQAAMAALAGLLFFGEVLSPWLLVGLVLTVVGLLYMRQGKSVREAPPEEV